MEFTCHPDCTNAPRMALLRDLNVAFAAANVDGVLSAVTNGFVWAVVGDDAVTGAEAVASALRTMDAAEALELRVILAQGLLGAVEGTVVMADGTQYDFCDVYEFDGRGASARVARITSYVVERVPVA